MSNVFEHKKKTGRPRVDSELLRSRMERHLIDALDTFIAAQPKPQPSRPEAIRMLLRDSLTNLGFIKHREDPEGAN